MSQLNYSFDPILFNELDQQTALNDSLANSTELITAVNSPIRYEPKTQRAQNVQTLKNVTLFKLYPICKNVFLMDDDGV